MNESNLLESPEEEEEEEFQKQGEGNYTGEGRYIPYSGGSAGWDTNKGVLKSEMGNNYRYQETIDSAAVRFVQFKRMEHMNDRRGGKVRVLKKTNVKVDWNDQIEMATTEDISLQGIKLQFLDKVSMRKGDECDLEVLDDKDRGVAKVKGIVVWKKEGGLRRKIISVGIAFTKVPNNESESLRSFLHLL